MKHLERLFTQEVPPPLRSGAYTAIATAGSRILVKSWAESRRDEDEGCVVVVGAFGAINEPINAQMINDLGSHWKREIKLAEMLGGVSADLVRKAWHEWDKMNDDGRARFVALIRKRLELLPLEEDEFFSVMQPPVEHESVLTKVKVAALSVVLLLGTAIGFA